MNNIGTLTIEMAANIVRLEQGMAMARREVSESMEQIKRSVEMAQKALELLGVGLGVREFAEMIKSVLETSRRLQELSQQLGVSVKDIAGYRLSAALTGTTMDAVGTSIKKFSTFMVEHNDLLHKAGITATNATEGLDQIADIFHALPDGVEKTALAVKLFGRNGIEMITMLNQGSEKLEEQRQKSEALAAEYQKLAPHAEKFNEDLQELKMKLEAAGINITSALIPALTSAVEWLGKASVEGGTLQKTFDALVATGIVLASVKLGGLASQAVLAIIANRALAAQALLTAEALRVSAESAVFDAYNTATLTAAKMQLARAEAAVAAAATEGSVASGLASTAMGALGGPVGLVTTALLLGAAAWVEWGAAKNKAFGETTAEELNRLKQELVDPGNTSERTIMLAKEISQLQAKIDAENAAAAATVAATNSTTEAEAKRKAQILLDAENVKKAKEAYDAFIRSVQEKIAVEQAELAAGRPLTEAEKEKAELEAKVLALMKQFPGYSHAEADAIVKRGVALHAENEERKFSDELYAHAATRAAEAFDANEREIAQIVESTARLSEENANLSLGAEAMDALKIKRIDDAIAREQQTLAILDALPQDSAEIKQIRDKIAALEDLKVATGQNITAHALHAQAEQWKQFMDEIDRGLTDALLHGFEGGKDAGKNFIDSVKHMLETAAFKMVIQTLVNPVLNSAAQAAGINTGPAGQAGGLLNMAGTANNAYSMFGGGGGLSSSFMGSGVGSLYGSFAESGLGTSLGLSTATSVGYAAPVYDAAGALLSAGSGGTAGGLTALGSSIGAAIPWVAGAIAIYSLLSSKHKDDPHDNPDSKLLAARLTDAGVSSPLDYQAHGLGSLPDWVVSGKTSGAGRWADHPAVDQGTLDALGKATQAVFDSGRKLADILGVDAHALDGVGVESENFKSAEDALSQLSDQVALALLPDIGKFQQGTETLSQTIARVAGDIQGFDDIAKHLGVTLNLTGDAAARATSIENMIAAGGGSQAFSTNLAGFYNDYFSNAERQANALKDLTDQFKALGYAVPADKLAFRELITTLLSSGDAGRITAAKMLTLESSFSQLEDAATSADSALGTLSAQLSATQKSALEAINTQISLSQTAASTAHQAADAYRTLTTTLANAADQLKLGSLSPLDPAAKYAAAGSSLQTLFQSAMTGNTSALGNLPEAINEWLTASRAMNSSSQTFTDDYNKAQSMLAQAQGASTGAAAGKDYQATLLDAQTTLLGQIKDQLSAADPNTAILASQSTLLQTIGGLLDGQYSSTLTGNAIEDAIKNISANDAQVSSTQLQALIQGTTVQTDQFVAMVQGTNTTVSLLQQLVNLTQQMLQNQIAALYQSILQRAPDASGLQYWTQQAASGMTTTDIAAAISASPEAKAEADITQLYAQVFNRTPDSGGLQYWTAQEMGGMSLADIEAAMAASPEAQAIPRHLNGLYRVPHDNYLMRADKDETVLTASQAIDWRSGERGISGMDLSGLREDIRGVRDDLRNLAVIVHEGDVANVEATEGVAKTHKDIAHRGEIQPKQPK